MLRLSLLAASCFVVLACSATAADEDNVSDVAEALRATPSGMTAACRATLLEALSEGSVQSTAKEIVHSLKKDWTAQPDAATVHYDECGPSDFFTVTVRKSDCKVVELESGDSDGECK